MPIRGFINADLVACYTEAPGGGDTFDLAAPRNRPALDPGAWLELVQWHIDFFQYELAFPIVDVVINHPALAGNSKYWGPGTQYFLGGAGSYTSNIQYMVPGQTTSSEYTLFNHDLGYVPLAFVAYAGRILMPGVAVQVASEGRSRFVSAFVTSTTVGLREVYNSSYSALPAVTRDYQVVVFRVPEVDAQRALFGNEGGDVVIGRGKIDTSRRYFKRGVAPGDSAFDIDRGPTVDIRRGRSRIVSGGVVTTEDGYAGSFAGPEFLAVGV